MSRARNNDGEIFRDGDLRLSVWEDDKGLAYFVYAGLDTLLYHGRSFREAHRVYLRELEKRR